MEKLEILVVEDEPVIAENIEYSLQTEGFHPSVVSTGAEALEHFLERPPAFVILDVGLPDQTGFDVCREMRKTSAVPILFLTARESEIDRVVGLELGADDYVTKPFSPRELVARVRAILRRSQPGTQDSVAAEEPLQCSGPFEVDPGRRAIRFRGQPLDLTRYEYGLLQFLVAHPGRVFTRDQLMDRVWDEPEASLDRTVDAHIKSLRAKLRSVDDSQEPIVTHRGVGYSMREDWGE